MTPKMTKEMRARAKAKGAKVTRKLQQREEPVRKTVPAPSPPAPAVDTAIVERVSEAMTAAVKETNEQAKAQSNAVQGLIQALESTINANRASKGAQPMRLKVHRDKNKLIEYIDVVPIEAKRVLN